MPASLLERSPQVETARLALCAWIACGASFPCVVAVITDEGTAGPSALELHTAMPSEGQEVPTNGRNVVVACTRSGKHATERASAK